MNRADQGKVTSEGVSGCADSADPGLAQAVAERARRTAAEARPGTPVADVAQGDQTDVPIPALSSARGATQMAGTPDHPNSGSERGRDDLRAAAPAEVLAGLIEVGLHAPEADCVQCENARRTAARILAAGWRPPLAAAPRLGRKGLGRRVSDVAVGWSREHDDRPGATATWETLTPELQELYMRVGEALFGLGMTWSPVPPAEVAEIGDEVIVSFAGRPVVARPLPVKVGWEGDQFVELPPDFAVPASPAAPSAEVDAEAAPDGWYPAAMREHDRANAAELDRNAARQRAASWWEAAKTLNRWGTAHRELHRKALVEITNLTAVRDELAHQRDDHRARADTAEAKLGQIRAAIAPFVDLGQDDVFDRIRAIVGEVQP